MNLLFTICGRAGSKGIKNKNIKNFLEKPLPLYTLSVIDLYLKKSDFSADIVINTDSDDLIDIFKKNSLRQVDVIERDPELSFIQKSFYKEKLNYLMESAVFIKCLTLEFWIWIMKMTCY